jgi:anaerobic C4-dicarboxylate transporter-like protein
MLAGLPETVLIWVHALVVVAAIILGVKTGGMSIGFWGAGGVLLLAFMGVAPGDQPISAVFIVLAVISAAGAMQVAGGIDWMVEIAKGILQKKPQNITYVAPYVSTLFTMGAGTGNIYFSLLPVIEDLAYKFKVRPERPLAVSSTSSQMAIVMSPVSAAMAVMVGLMEPVGYDIVKILLIVIPANLIAIGVMAFVAQHTGKAMEDDPEYKRRMASGELKPHVEVAAKELGPNARKSALIFLGGVVVIVLFGLFPQLKPSYMVGEEVESMSVTLLIQVVMMIVALLIVIFAKANVKEIVKTTVFDSGTVSLVALFGVAWLANTFIGAHEDLIVSTLGGVAETTPILFAVAIFVVGALTTSQSSTTSALVPIGLAIGIPPQFVIAMWSAVIGIYAFPINGSQIATVEFDRTGTTKMGKYMVDHSFIVPTLIAAVVSVLAGIVIAALVFGTGAA